MTRSPNTAWTAAWPLAAATASGIALAALMVSLPGPAAGPDATARAVPVEPAPTTAAATSTTSTTTTSTTTTTTAAPATVPAQTGEPSWSPYTIKPGTDGIAPLTGLAPDPAAGNRPVLAVKVDNAPKARGQWNLDWADVVFEENVEGVTRFIALFQSRQPQEIGPIRSARTSDLDVLAGLNRPLLAWSGGNDIVTAWVRAAHQAGALVNVSAFTAGRCYRRSDQRPKPHNLLVDPACLRSVGDGGPARALWAFHPDGTTISGEPVSDFTVAMDGVKAAWQWDQASGRYLRSQNGEAHQTAGGTRIAATNVVVAEVPYITSRADPRSPEAVTVGSGRVVVHTNGVARRGRWIRATNTDPWLLVTDNGQTITLAPGTTWFHLARGL